MEKESVRKDSRKVGSGRKDSTLSVVAKVWADLLLGHTAPPGTTGITPPPSWAQITLLPPQACPLVDGLVTLLSSWGWLSGSLRFSSVQVVCMLPLAATTGRLRPVAQMHHRSKELQPCC